MKSSVKAMERRAEFTLTNQQQEIRVSCHACGSETPVHITFQKPLSDIPLVEDPNQMGLEGFPVQRFPVLGKKAPREIPVSCVCGAFSLARRKSEPWPHEAAEIRLYKCQACKANVLTRETFWKTTSKSYVEGSPKNDD